MCICVLKDGVCVCVNSIIMPCVPYVLLCVFKYGSGGHVLKEAREKAGGLCSGKGGEEEREGGGGGGGPGGGEGEEEGRGSMAFRTLTSLGICIIIY